MAEIIFKLKGLEKMEKELEYLKSHAVKVGVLGNGGSGSVSVQEYAIFNEYGTSRGIPPRPFFRLSVGTANAQKNIKTKARQLILQVVNGEISGEEFYNQMGTYLVKKIKRTIMSGNFATLNPQTIKKKGHSKPLIDTHSLYNSINYEIVGV